MITSSKDSSSTLRAERIAVETLYRAFSEKNPDLVDAVLAPDWRDIPMAPGQEAGPAGVKAIILLLASAFPDLHIAVEDMLQEPGKIAVRAELTGTHLGEIFGIAPTGKRIRFRLYEFHNFAGGLITSTWHIEDWFGLFTQIGHFPPLP